MTAEGPPKARIAGGGYVGGGLAQAPPRHIQDSEDVFQEVFARFFRHEEELESDQHRKAWLIRCTLNCTNTLLSARWRTNLPLEEAVTQCMAPEDRQVYSAVLALPQKYRTAIHLHYYEGYTVDEIAALTGARAGTVKSWLSRGREKLAAELKGDD